MPISGILICAALVLEVVAAFTRDVRWLASGLALLTAAQLFYGK